MVWQKGSETTVSFKILKVSESSWNSTLAQNMVAASRSLCFGYRFIVHLKRQVRFLRAVSTKHYSNITSSHDWPCCVHVYASLCVCLSVCLSVCMRVCSLSWSKNAAGAVEETPTFVHDHCDVRKWNWFTQTPSPVMDFRYICKTPVIAAFIVKGCFWFKWPQFKVSHTFHLPLWHFGFSSFEVIRPWSSWHKG